MKNIDKWIADYIHGILMLDEECRADILIDDVCYSCDCCPLQDNCDNEDNESCGENLREWALKEYEDEV